MELDTFLSPKGEGLGVRRSGTPETQFIAISISPKTQNPFLLSGLEEGAVWGWMRVET
jgi:hypothetical protein